MQHKLIAGALACTALFATAAPAAALVNILPTHTTSVTFAFNSGNLRDATWSTGNTASNPLAPIDGSFQPEGTQWNNGSYWWDEVVTGTPTYWEIGLDALYTFQQFVVQADDNDAYLLEYWDGSAWQTAANIPTQPSFGLVTRAAFNVGGITTDRLRFSAVSGDQYYALGQLQGFAVVPETATWAMMILGLGAAGASMRRRPKGQKALLGT
jgi:hypothetical protein